MPYRQKLRFISFEKIFGSFRNLLYICSMEIDRNIEKLRGGYADYCKESGKISFMDYLLVIGYTLCEASEIYSVINKE